MPADGHQLSKFQATGHTAGVAHAESHEDHGDRDHGFGSVGGRRWDVVWFTQGLQETRAISGFRNSQLEIHRPVARELETRIFATTGTEHRNDNRYKLSGAARLRTSYDHIELFLTEI